MLRTIRKVFAVGLVGIVTQDFIQAQPKPDLAETPPAVGKTYYPVSETPWFSHPEVRRELDLKDEHYKLLHEGYGEARDRYDQKRLQLAPTVSEQERMQDEEKLHAEFHNDVLKQSKEKIPREIQRQRYNQLYWQHRGIGAFNDPTVQSQLNLTPEQRAKFRTMERDWNTQMSGLRRDYRVDPDRVIKRFNEGRSEFNEGIRSLLDEKQLEGYQDLTGKPYDFPPEVYFQKEAVARPTIR